MRSHRALWLPPLVPSSPILGSARELAEDPVQFWVRAARKYGPAYRVRFPTAPTGEIMVLAGLEANQFAALHGHQVFAPRHPQETQGPFSHATRVKPALSREATNPFVQDMIRTVERRVAVLKDGDTIPVLEFIERITIDELELSADGCPIPDNEFEKLIRYAGRICVAMLYTLLKHEPILNRVRDEVDGTYARGTPSLQDLQAMATLRNCVRETLRLYAVAPTVPRYAAATFDFQGYTIPEGSYVFVAVVVPHFDERYFINPGVFDPDRFARPRSEGERPYAYAPFGLGVDVYPNAGLVETIVMTTVCGMLRRMDFEIDPTGYELRSKVDALPGPERKFRLRVHPRNVPTVPVSHSPETDLEAALPYLKLSAEELKRFADGIVRKTYSPSAVIIRQGQAANEFFVVLEGVAEVEREDQQGHREQVAVIGAGGYFGEIGLLHKTRRTATVRAGGRGITVLGIGRDLFTHMVAEHDLVSSEIARMAQRRVMVNQLAEAIPGLTREAMAAASQHLEHKRFAPGEILIQEGEAPDQFFIIVAGEAEVVNHHPRGDIVLGHLGAGDYFGEIGILQNRPRTATVRAAGTTGLEVLSLGRDHFLALQAAGHYSGHAIAEKVMQRVVAQTEEDARRP